MLILKTIERNAGPMHGYGIARYIKQISNDVLQDWCWQASQLAWPARSSLRA
jgi:hypothetical protein